MEINQHEQVYPVFKEWLRKKVENLLLNCEHKIENLDIPSYEIISFLHSHPNGVERFQTRVLFSSNLYNQKLMHHGKQERIKERIDHIWSQKTLKNPNLFNAAKFRLAEVYLISLKDNPPIIQLRLGLTDYKSYVCINDETVFIRDCKSIGHQMYFNPIACLPNKLGVACLVCTSDNFILFIHRSKHVGVYQNTLDLPGGHPEPKAVEGIIDPKKESVIDINSLNELIRDQVYDSIVMEIQDEININISYLTPPVLLGVVMQSETWTPSLTFWTNCSLSIKQINEEYKKGPKESFESDHLVWYDYEQLLDMSLIDFKSPLTPSAKGSIELLKELNFQKNQKTSIV